tara:strand:- start:1872 stop:2018 length:147 start_codon:yes stop_codon:yes gene_type:complete
LSFATDNYPWKKKIGHQRFPTELIDLLILFIFLPHRDAKNPAGPTSTT